MPGYAKCVALEIAVFIAVGVPEPRARMAPQLDKMGWFYPELRISHAHGAEPWEELAVKLMLEWLNLFYSNSAFAPRRAPPSIIDYTTREAPKRTRRDDPLASVDGA